MKFFFCLSLLSILLFACDPGHHGMVAVQNHSNDTLQLRYVTVHNGDTLTRNLLPGQEYQYSFSGLGKAKKYDCCPCEYRYLVLTDINSGKTITKDIHKSENWNLDKSEIKAFKGGELRCEFMIHQSDITP